MATTSGLLHMTKTPDKRVESTLWKLRVLAGNGREKAKMARSLSPPSGGAE
jgi:hypothetical protein